eukprot:4619951-Pleurochrysis_carterae.AAC.3
MLLLLPEQPLLLKRAFVGARAREAGIELAAFANAAGDRLLIAIANVAPQPNVTTAVEVPVERAHRLSPARQLLVVPS